MACAYFVGSWLCGDFLLQLRVFKGQQRINSMIQLLRTRYEGFMEKYLKRKFVDLTIDEVDLLRQVAFSSRVNNARQAAYHDGFISQWMTYIVASLLDPKELDSRRISATQDQAELILNVLQKTGPRRIKEQELLDSIWRKFNA